MAGRNSSRWSDPSWVRRLEWKERVAAMAPAARDAPRAETGLSRRGSDRCQWWYRRQSHACELIASPAPIRFLPHDSRHTHASHAVMNAVPAPQSNYDRQQGAPE